MNAKGNFSKKQVVTQIKNPKLIEEKHKQIIRAASELFSKKGYHATTLREISAESGINLSYLYKYISSKDDILYLHLESAYDQFRQHCKRIDYEGELIDLKSLRRLVRENHRQGGYVVADGERVYFGVNTSRRRAVGVDFSKTDLVGEDDFQIDDNVDKTNVGAYWSGYQG